MAKVKPKMTTKNAPVAPKASKIVMIPIEKISTKTFENSRSGKWDQPSGDTEAERDWASFKASFPRNGQETAVLVRPYAGNNKNKKGEKFEFELIVGYRRYSAIEQLADEGLYQPVIKAEVREMTNLEARRANGVENLGREDLSPQDQAFAVFQLAQEYTAEGKEIKDNLLADELSISQAYAGRLLKIMRNLKPSITKSWRKDAIPLSVNDMLGLAEKDLPPAEQQAAYDELVKAVSTEKSERTKGPSAWIDTAVKTAERFGTFMALAEDQGFIAVADVEWDETLINFLAENGFVKIGKKGADSKALNKIGKAALKGYSEAVAKRDERLAKAEAKAAKAAVATN